MMAEAYPAPNLRVQNDEVPRHTKAAWHRGHFTYA
jgi:hypothetical protein